MKKNPWLIAILVLVVLLASSVQAAPSVELQLDRSLLSAGGGLATGGEYSLQASFGQVFGGTSTGGGYRLDSGFLIPDEKRSYFYLPIITQ